MILSEKQLLLLFKKTIKEILGPQAIVTLKEQSEETYHISLRQLIKNPDKLHLVLIDVLGKGPAKLITTRFRKQTIEKLRMTDKCWTKIYDPSIVQLILQTLGNEEKKEILFLVSEKPMTAIDIVAKSKQPQTSVYRKIKELLETGFLSLDKYEFVFYNNINNKRKVPTYIAVMHNYEISINDKITTILIQKNQKSDDSNCTSKLFLKSYNRVNSMVNF